MQLLFSEFQSDYKNYHFPYQVYGLHEEDDSLDTIYQNGFLPTRLDSRLFYLARSFRVDLKSFELSSENRRVSRKNSDLSMELIDLGKFNYIYTIGKMGKDFYDSKFGRKTMSAQKIKWLFNSSSMTHVIEYRLDDEVIGYTLCSLGNKIMHYAYPFYDIKKDRSNLGMGMMLKAVQQAKDEGLEKIYLGTVYTEESLYKTQFSGGEYFTGFGWSDNVPQLKEQIRNPHDTHLFNMIENKTDFIDSLISPINE